MSVAMAGRSWALSRVTALELRLLAEAQLVLISCQLAKWQRPIGRLIAPDSKAAAGGTDGSDREMARSVAWAVTRAAKYGVFRPQCLVRSLAIQRMLRRRGVVTGSLNIGVRMQEGSFEAHAWVELDGAVVGDSLQHVQTFTKVTDLRMVEL